jgi:hypothetical protein
MDLRHALRSLLRTPWYSATVVGTIALGLALATTVFALVDGALLRPLPYPRAHELYLINGPFSLVKSMNEIRAWAAAVPDVPLAAYEAPTRWALRSICRRCRFAPLGWGRTFLKSSVSIRLQADSNRRTSHIRRVPSARSFRTGSGSDCSAVRGPRSDSHSLCPGRLTQRAVAMSSREFSRGTSCSPMPMRHPIWCSRSS